MLLLDTSLTDLLRGDVREIVTAIISALMTSPAALAAFVASSLLVLLGGSAVTFVVKGGTVALLAESERIAGPIEKPPLISRRCVVRRSLRSSRSWPVAAALATLRGDRNRASARLRLTAVAYLAFVFRGYELAANSAILLIWTAAAALASSALIVWITLINFFYLMTQMVVAIEDVSVSTGVRLAAIRLGPSA